MQMAIVTKDIDLNKAYFKKVSQDAKDFITRACKKDVSERLSAKQLLEHPWIVNTMANQERYTITKED